MKKTENWSNVKNGVVRRFLPVIKIKKLIEGAGYRQIRCRFGTGTGTGTYKTGTGTGTLGAG